MLDNAEWLTALKYIEFLRDVGRHFTVNRMLSKDFRPKLRLEHEQVLSSWSSLHAVQPTTSSKLLRRIGCTWQPGGSDQWGNIVHGLELARRMRHPVFAWTSTRWSPPLRSARWVRRSPAPSGLTTVCRSPFDYWQFWRNTEDADVGRFLRLFTFFRLAEIKRS